MFEHFCIQDHRKKPLNRITDSPSTKFGQLNFIKLQASRREKLWKQKPRW